jgi:hypothetical protein
VTAGLRDQSPAEATPAQILVDAVAALAAGLQADGTLHDPVFGCPTQYGGAYFAWCCSVLAEVDPDRSPVWRRRADLALRAAVAHTTDPAAEPYASGFDRTTLSVVAHANHRDFTWPPILRTYLRDPTAYPDLRSAICGLDVLVSFRSRPPSNWAAVWLSGEWLRMGAGLSSTAPDQFDAWLDPFFRTEDGTGFDLETGMYRERGLPNSYDLFTRLHMTDLLSSGYAGRHRDGLVEFLAAGLRRSLDLQLSDGSVASGYRSAGQTWVLGAQVALFTAADRLGLGTETDRATARLAAWRAFSSLARWQRSNGILSPVQNTLAPQLRVGYEHYTADGHYSPLALAFLAAAVVAGFGNDPAPSREDLDRRFATVRPEGAATGRGSAHLGRISIGVHAQADPTYDACGLVDASFGTGRLLHLVSAARHVSGGPWLVPGLAVRSRAGAAVPTAVCARRHRPADLLYDLGPAGLAFSSVLEPPTVLDDDPDHDLLSNQRYQWASRLTETGLEVVEETPGLVAHQTLLLPYLVDAGTGETTVVEPLDDGVRLRLGGEWLDVTTAAPLERCSVLTAGYESRRGWCGLVRLDLAEPADTLRWRVVSSD